MLAAWLVSSTADGVDAAPGDGLVDTSPAVAGEQRTLRAAIQEANATADADTIQLAAGTYTLSIAGQGENAAATGDLDITRNLTIIGAGASATIIDASGLDRVFQVFPGITLNLSRLTITGGNASSSWSSTVQGGGIFNEGRVTLTDCVVSGNSANLTGGGVFSAGVSSSLAVTNSSFLGNRAIEQSGGAVFVGFGSSASLSVTNSSFSGNTAHRDGAAIALLEGSATIVNSTFNDNSAGFDFGGAGGGGAIYNGGTTSVTNSTLSANSATSGGGISNAGTLTLLNSTIAGNSTRAAGFGVEGPPVPGPGGGIVNRGTLNLKNTIVADNTAPNGPDVAGTVLSQGNNLIKNTSGSSGWFASDRLNVDPLLGPLQNNGGRTLTRALLLGSPAIDAGTNSGAPLADQRGISRPQDGDNNGSSIADIGAIEHTPGLFNSRDVPKSIPHLGTVRSTITVSDSFVIDDLNVLLDITHTFDEDLDVFLIGPDGTRVELFTDVGSTGDNFTSTLLDSQASTPITAGAAPFFGIFRPEGSLSAFNGRNIGGTWTLEINDDVAADFGELNSWSIIAKARAANRPPVLAPIANQVVNEGSLLSFTATASDPDAGQQLTFSLDAGAPAGASINSSTGQFSWTPSEAQGSGNYTVTVRVTDNGSPSQSDAKTFNIAVGEVNSAPVLAAIANQTIVEGNLLSFNASASDADLPANSLTFSLDAGAPVGAAIHPTTGNFTWTPGSNQGPGSYTLTVRVTDNGTPALSDAKSFTVTVQDSTLPANRPPLLATIGNRSVSQGGVLTFTATASDPDAGQQLTYRLEAGAPVGASINSSTGAFSWSIDSSQAAGDYNVTVRVSDNGVPSLSDTETFVISVLSSASTAVFTSSDVPKIVPLESTVTSTIAISESFAIADLNVRLNISHTWDADLDVFLVGPNGTRVELFTEVGGDGDNFSDTVFDDQAANAIASGLPPFTGTYRPEGSLSAFNGIDMRGVWTLEVTDWFAEDSGVLNSWSLIATRGSSTPVPTEQVRYLSTTSGGTLTNSDGTRLTFADADILQLTIDSRGAYRYAFTLDGSDVGLSTSSEDIDAFVLLPDGSILISTVGSFSVNTAYSAPATGSGSTLTGAGEDLLRFIPGTLGANTTGSWSLYFDGSDVGLSGSNENIDSVAVLADGRLLISTFEAVSVSGVSGQDEDLLAFTPTALGATTRGTWSMYFDGSDVGLANSSSEDINGLFVSETVGVSPTLYFSTQGNFAVSNASGANEDIFSFAPTQLGSHTAGAYAPGLVFDGSLYGLSSFDVDGIRLGQAPGQQLAPAAALATSSALRIADPASVTPLASGPLAGRIAPPVNAPPVNLSADALNRYVDEAVERWAAAGLADEHLRRLDRVSVQVADLPADYLGLAGQSVIYIDRDAAGHGWFLDPTPDADEEFAVRAAGHPMRAAASHPAARRVDLLTVLAHELGHVLGFDDLDPFAHSSGVMSGTLPVGQRNLPSPSSIDSVFDGELSQYPAQR